MLGADGLHFSAGAAMVTKARSARLQQVRRPVPKCFLCLGNDLLKFDAIEPRGVAGYIVIGSMPVDLDGDIVLVPLPFSYLLVAKSHPRDDASGGYGFTFPADWTGTKRCLLRSVPGLRPGDPWDILAHYGHAAGSRVSPIDSPDDGIVPPHPFEWLVTERHRVPEDPSTETIGLATILFNSRRTAGRMPDGVTLALLWRNIVAANGGVAEYHSEILRLIR